MTPAIEEYVALLRIILSNPNKVFWKKTKSVGFVKKMSQITQIMSVDAKVIEQAKKKKGKK